MDDGENLSSTKNLQTGGDDSSGSCILLEPLKFGRYTSLRGLAKGGFGEVFLAVDEELDRRVAIKVPLPERVSQPKEPPKKATPDRLDERLRRENQVRLDRLGLAHEGLRIFIVGPLRVLHGLPQAIEGRRLMRCDPAGVRPGQGRPGPRATVRPGRSH